MRRDQENHEVVIEAVYDDGRDDAFGPVRQPAHQEAEDQPHRELVEVEM
jgi:hypothetical protein